MLRCAATGTDPIVPVTSPFPSCFGGSFTWMLAGVAGANYADRTIAHFEDAGSGSALQILWQNGNQRIRAIHSNANTRTLNLEHGGAIAEGDPFLVVGRYDTGSTPGTRAWIKAPGLATFFAEAATGSTNVPGLTVDTVGLFGTGWQGTMALALASGLLGTTDEEGDAYFETLYDAWLGANDAVAGGGSLAKLLAAFQATPGLTLNWASGFRHLVAGRTSAGADTPGGRIGDVLVSGAQSRLQLYAAASQSAWDEVAVIGTPNATVTIVDPYDDPVAAAIAPEEEIPVSASDVPVQVLGGPSAVLLELAGANPRGTRRGRVADNSRAVRTDETGGIALGENPGNWQHGFMEARKAQVSGVTIPFQTSQLNFSGATWTEATSTLTKAGAFTSYTHRAGSLVYIGSGTNATVGAYEILSSTANTLVLKTSISAIAADLGTGDIDGSVHPKVARWGLGVQPRFGANCIQIDGTTLSESFSRLMSGSPKSGGVGPGIGTLIPPYSSDADEARILVGPIAGSKLLATERVRARVLFCKLPGGGAVTLYPEKATSQAGVASSAGSSVSATMAIPSRAAFFQATSVVDAGRFSLGEDASMDTVAVGDTVLGSDFNASGEWTVGRITEIHTEEITTIVEVSVAFDLDYTPSVGLPGFGGVIGAGEPQYQWSEWVEMDADETNVYRGLRVRNTGSYPVLALDIQVEAIVDSGLNFGQFGWSGNGLAPQREEFWSDGALRAYLAAMQCDFWIQFNANQNTTVVECVAWKDQILRLSGVGDILWIGGPENAENGSGPGYLNDLAIYNNVSGTTGLSMRQSDAMGTIEEQWTKGWRADTAHLSHRGNTAVATEAMSLLLETPVAAGAAFRGRIRNPRTRLRRHDR